MPSNDVCCALLCFPFFSTSLIPLFFIDIMFITFHNKIFLTTYPFIFVLKPHPQQAFFILTMWCAECVFSKTGVSGSVLWCV